MKSVFSKFVENKKDAINWIKENGQNWNGVLEFYSNKKTWFFKSDGYSGWIEIKK